VTPGVYPWQAWLVVAAAAGLLCALASGLLPLGSLLTAAFVALSPDPARRHS
jgi:predicted lysophospholipase L1 biosynthesis ABC-type transport system permease subunit